MEQITTSIRPAERALSEPSPVIGPAGLGWTRAGPRRSINFVLILVQLAHRRGLRTQQLLAGTDLCAADLADLTRTVSFADEFTLIRNLQSHCGDEPGLGLDAGELYHFTSLTWLGFAMLSSPSLRHAFDLSVRYCNLGMSLVRVALARQAQDLHIALIDHELPTDIRRFAAERTLMVGLNAYGRLLGRRVVPMALEFGFAAPDSGAHVYARRLGVVPTFDAKRTCMVISARDADEPLPNANALALRIAEDYGRRLAEAAAADDSLAMRVRRMIAAEPTRNSEMRRVAMTLCMSERTLRRHLQQEGTNFAALCEQVRESMAEQLLGMRRMPVEHVAERLGYAETSSFIHAFKRWKGVTPHAYRSRLRAVPNPAALQADRTREQSPAISD